MQPHEGHVQHVGCAKAIPRIQHAVLPPTDGDAKGLHFLYPRQATAFGIAVMPSLQGDVDQGVRNGGHAGCCDQGQQFGHIVIVHRMHRGQVAARRPRAKAVAGDLCRQRLDMAAVGIVRLITVQIQHQATLCREARHVFDGGSTVFHCAFKMRDAAHHTHAHIQRADQVFAAIGAAVKPVLREGHQLQVDVGGDDALHLQHSRHAAQVVGRGVNMGAYRKQAH